MTVVDLLQQIGLNKYEAEAYHILLIRGALTGYEVGKYSQVPGSRSYEVLERLVEKGLALVQPGDPPRFRAQDPQLVFERYRSTMESTLSTLATLLASLAHHESRGEFWVVRGVSPILAQAKTLMANAQTKLDLVLPSGFPLTEDLAQTSARGCRVLHMTPEAQDDSILLVRDELEVLIGTLTPSDTCQAVLSSNRALLDAVHGYFLYHQSPGRITTELGVRSSQPRPIDWMDWEARKQRHLRRTDVA